jgi:hypothetical protein
MNNHERELEEKQARVERARAYDPAGVQLCVHCGRAAPTELYGGWPTCAICWSQFQTQRPRRPGLDPIKLESLRSDLEGER